MSQKVAAVRAFVGLGGNLGDAAATLQAAVNALRQWRDITVNRVSSLYCSPPLGPKDQPDYHNAVVELHTALSALGLLHGLQAIEQRFGRQRQGVRWGPRTLDLDLLLYADEEITTEELTVPHPGLRERAFVLYPLHEIAPELVLPGGERLSALLAQVPRQGLNRVSEVR